MIKQTATLFAATAVAAGALAMPAQAAHGSAARGSDAVAGHCSGNSSVKIKAKHRDGRIETEFEVDQNVNGVTWRVRLMRDGNVVWRGRATTHAPSGSFSIERKIGNGPGSDKVTGRAVNPATGEVCRASVTI